MFHDPPLVELTLKVAARSHPAATDVADEDFCVAATYGAVKRADASGSRWPGRIATTDKVID